MAPFPVFLPSVNKYRGTIRVCSFRTGTVTAGAVREVIFVPRPKTANREDAISTRKSRESDP